MPTMQTVRKKAKSFYNYSESNGKAQKYIIRPWNKWTGRSVNCKVTPWCQIFVGSVMHQCKATYTKTSGCKQAIDWYKSKKRWKARSAKPKVGYQIFVNGHKHTGLITSVDSKKKGYLIYISGNCNNAVKYSSIKYTSNKKIDGYGIPYYSDM